MTIVEIIARENNAHRNQCGNISCIPEGWAVVPEGLDTPNFPFGNIVAEEIDGVMTVTQWTACPCPEPENTPKLVNSIDLSSYFAFCADVNSNSIECAFGKNNEDRILNLGLQLAMYSWYCGDSKTDYPYTELCKCCKLTDIETNDAAFKELWENETLRKLYMGWTAGLQDSTSRPYPSNRVMERLAYVHSALVTPIEITDEDIEAGYLWLVTDIHPSNEYGKTSAHYFNDVLVAEYVIHGVYHIIEGIQIKLSDCGINSPGLYNYELKGSHTGKTNVYYTIYRKTAFE